MAFHVVKTALLSTALYRQTTIASQRSSPSQLSFRGPARLLWLTIWQDSARISTTGDNLYVDLDGNRVTKTDAHFTNNISFSYDPSDFMSKYNSPLIAQIGVNNVFNQKASDDDIRRALNDFTSADILGRSCSLRLRAAF